MKESPRKSPGQRAATTGQYSRLQEETATAAANGKPKWPFIPAWLDKAGLSQPTFRIYCHMLRSADNSTGIAWPSIKTICKVCQTSKSTAIRSIKELIAKGLLEKLPKDFQGSCRYRPTVPPEGRLVSNSVTGGNIATPPMFPLVEPNVPSGGTPIVSPEGKEGNPKKVPHRRESNSEVSEDGLAFADWFRSLLPAEINLKSDWRNSFAKIHDQLVAIDHRTQAEIRAVCQWARTEPFWSTNFMSPAKLRKRNGDGVNYYDLFREKMKPASPKPAALPINTDRKGKEIELPS